jgi:hypothetical protein
MSAAESPRPVSVMTLVETRETAMSEEPNTQANVDQARTDITNEQTATSTPHDIFNPIPDNRLDDEASELIQQWTDEARRHTEEPSQATYDYIRLRKRTLELERATQDIVSIFATLEDRRQQTTAILKGHADIDSPPFVQEKEWYKLELTDLVDSAMKNPENPNNAMTKADLLIEIYDSVTLPLSAIQEAEQVDGGEARNVEEMQTSGTAYELYLPDGHKLETDVSRVAEIREHHLRVLCAIELAQEIAKEIKIKAEVTSKKLVDKSLSNNAVWLCSNESELVRKKFIPTLDELIDRSIRRQIPTDRLASVYESIEAPKEEVPVALADTAIIAFTSEEIEEMGTEPLILGNSKGLRTLAISLAA